MSRIKPILITTTSVLALVFIWSLLSPKSEPAKAENQSIQQKNNVQSNNALLSRIQALEDELANEQSIRQQHELRLSELEQQLINTQAITHDTAVMETDKASGEPVKTSIKPQTLQEKLLATSIPLDTIQRIQQRIGQNRLTRLELRNQAIREEWIDSPEYIEKEQQLPGATDGLREEFGDQIFDQYLYASGRPNRVVVTEVYSGSAAKTAGIEPGDIILSYASSTIFSMRELQLATTEGISGEIVLIEILRDNSPFSTSVPRGPLGISMTITRKEP